MVYESDSSSSGYGQFNPPKEEKRLPLSHGDTRGFYQTAMDFPDREIELAGRVLLDYGLRLDELCHSRSHWVKKEYNRKLDTTQWRIRIPKVENCWGGTGGEAKKKNKGGDDLHNTNKLCTLCVGRGWQGKVAPLDDDGEPQPEKGWLTWNQAEEYGFAPKSERSASKVWQLGSLEESAETARLLKEFLEQQPHKQWPHGQGAVRDRIDKIVEHADLEFPDRSGEKVIPHALRHTYGCRLVEMGVSEGIGMKQMRHQNSDVFQWYADVRGTRVQTALREASSDSDSLS
jgi:hypothetical protein